MIAGRKRAKGDVAVQTLIIKIFLLVVVIFTLVIIWQVAVQLMAGICYSNAAETMRKLEVTINRDLEPGGHERVGVSLGKCATGIAFLNRKFIEDEALGQYYFLEPLNCDSSKEAFIIFYPSWYVDDNYVNKKLWDVKKPPIWRVPTYIKTKVDDALAKYIRDNKPICRALANDENRKYFFENDLVTIEGSPNEDITLNYCVDLMRSAESTDMISVVVEEGPCEE